MKTTRVIWAAICTAVVTAATAFRAAADQTVATTKSEKSYTGTVASVDPREHVLSVKGWTMLNKAFNLGDNCTYALLENGNASAKDLRPGEMVVVSYQNVHGVLIASRVEQQPMQFEGTVKAIDNEQHVLTLHRTALDKQLQIADNCVITLRNGKTGALADVLVGNHVTVTYETPDGIPTARQIEQTSITFTGTLTAIDLGEKTIKAKAMAAPKKFSVADDCAIVINGKAGGRLADLRPDEKLMLSYDEINGVNVVSRIGPAEVPSNSVASIAPPVGY